MYGVSLQPISHSCHGLDCKSAQTCKWPYDFSFNLAATRAEAQYIWESSIYHFFIRKEAILTLRNCNSTSTGCTKKSKAGTLEEEEDNYSNTQSSSSRKYSTPKKKKNYNYVPSIAIRKPEFESSQLQNVDTKSTAPGSEEFSASEFIKTAPVLAPAGTTARYDRPLEINLDLAVYRAKSLARKGDYNNAEEILRHCIRNWPENGRSYMTLGRLLTKQGKYVEARSVFENGCQATQGANAFLWQGWAILEKKMRNITKARKLFDAAIVADKKHVAAWHGWAFLEINEGNVKKGRDLLGKGLKYCGQNEYIFQTLALLEVKAKRYEQARSLFSQAIKCNPKSCASWLAWAQLEAEQERNIFARRLFERAVQASPKNRLVWQNWALFETSQGEYDKARKLFRVGHALNPRDPVLLQSLALFEYKCSSATIAREIFKKACQVDPSHQPIWIAWGWMEWKERNIATARELYQQALEIDSKSPNAARCLQAWGILEEREGNIGTARRLFKLSINIDSQNFVTWMSWAALEENLGNSERAEEIRNLYFQQEIQEHFANYMVNDSLGVIANSHMAFADQEREMARSSKCLRLAELHSTAVDFAKTGVPVQVPVDLFPKKYPDFMEKEDKESYESTSILGKLYRYVTQADIARPNIAEKTYYDHELEVAGFDRYLDEASRYKSQYDSRLVTLMDHYGIRNEADIISGNIASLSNFVGSNKRKGDIRETIMSAVKSLKQEARRWFDSDTGKQFDKASAWYYVTYHPSYRGERNSLVPYDNSGHLISFPWVVHDILLRIKRRGHQTTDYPESSAVRENRKSHSSFII